MSQLAIHKALKRGGFSDEAALEATESIVMHMTEEREKLATKEDLAALSAKLEIHRAETRAGFTELRAEMNGRFAEVDAKFAAMDAKFTAMDAKFTAMDGKFTVMDGKFTVMHSEVNATIANAMRKHTIWTVGTLIGCVGLMVALSRIAPL